MRSREVKASLIGGTLWLSRYCLCGLPFVNAEELRSHKLATVRSRLTGTNVCALEKSAYTCVTGYCFDAISYWNFCAGNNVFSSNRIIWVLRFL